MAEVDFEFKNDYTNHTSKTVHTLFDHGFLAANVFNTVAKKTEGLQSKISGKDFYFTSHYNKMFIEKNATLVHENARFVKKPCYFVSVGGYRDFPNRMTSNRNTAPTSTNNGVIRMFVALNPDRNNIHGHDYLGEPQYKVCQEFVNFGTTTSTHLDFDLCEEIARLNQENTLVQEELTRLIKEKVEKINKQKPCEYETLNIIEVSKTIDAFASKLNEEDVVVVVGGDGTLHHFANSIRHLTNTNQIYLYKGGTGNDFGREFKKEKLKRTTKN
jgi:hypothetical protein